MDQKKLGVNVPAQRFRCHVTGEIMWHEAIEEKRTPSGLESIWVYECPECGEKSESTIHFPSLEEPGYLLHHERLELYFQRGGRE